MTNATIKDVAREANVSIATVSRVLNNDKSVRAVTEKAVREAIQKVNYTPNSVARSLKRNTTSTIAMLVSDISNSFFTAVAKSIEDYVFGFGYSLIVCSTDNRKDKEILYLQMLKERHVDGLVLNTTNQNDNLVVQFSREIPVVLCNRNVISAAFQGDFVGSENITGMYALTMHLIENGHESIGLVTGPSGMSTSEERLKGYLLAMQKIGYQADQLKDLIVQADFTFSGGVYGARSFMERASRPTALILGNNEMATGALQYLQEAHISIPGELSLASYGEIENQNIMYVQPSIVTLNSYIIGRKIAELILERIENKNAIKNREYRYIPSLIPGNSVQKLKEAEIPQTHT